jgi:hypothetical protein
VLVCGTSERNIANFAFPHVSVCLQLEIQERKNREVLLTIFLEKASSIREKQAGLTHWAILSNIGNWMNITATLTYNRIVFEEA